MRKAMAIGIMVSVMAIGAAAQEAHAHHSGGGQLGTVDFQTSCDAPLRADFNRAVALLHSFEYDEARDAFSALAKKDPDCAMAQWGIAMTQTHGLWGEIDVKAGRAAAQSAATLAEKHAHTTAREKAFIAAIAALYDGDDVKLHERLKSFSDKMAQVHAAYPEDVEATIFYALLLDESASFGDKTRANERKCGELLEPLLAKYPQHPGVAHYLIHCYDNAELAQKGLQAARLYARIAPASAHAQHMPSHIFVRLGLWQETVDSNIGAMEAADKDAAASPCERRGNTMHAMHFLQFAYLQQGRLKQARDVALRSQQVPMAGDDCQVSADFVAASFALDAHDWALGRQLKAPAGGYRRDGLTWMAIGIGSARGGDLKRAREAEAALAALRDEMAKMMPAGAANPTEESRQRVAAWIAEAEGDHDKAVELLTRAADLGDGRGWAAWMLPPAREMLGDLLLAQNKPTEALRAYELVLKNEPRLFNPLYGAARAAELAGDHKAAAEYRARLQEIAKGGDRPEMAQLRSAKP
jgi:tetratricopeptide (TPR) repeat protein